MNILFLLILFLSFNELQAPHGKKPKRSSKLKRSFSERESPRIEVEQSKKRIKVEISVNETEPESVDIYNLDLLRDQTLGYCRSEQESRKKLSREESKSAESVELPETSESFSSQEQDPCCSHGQYTRTNAHRNKKQQKSTKQTNPRKTKSAGSHRQSERSDEPDESGESGEPGEPGENPESGEPLKLIDLTDYEVLYYQLSLLIPASQYLYYFDVKNPDVFQRERQSKSLQKARTYHEINMELKGVNKKLRFFTIHNFFPLFTEKVENCTNTPFEKGSKNFYHFQSSSIIPTIRDSLRYQNFSLWESYGYQRTYDFLYYNWFKHGTCCTKLNSMTKCVDYFKAVAGLTKKFNSEFFSLNPDYVKFESMVISYNKDEFKEKIQNATGKNAQLQCFSYNYTTNNVYYLLKEIRICYDENLKYTDCIAPDECNNDFSIRPVG